MPDPAPKRLFRVVDAETGEPVPLQCDYVIDFDGNVLEDTGHTEGACPRPDLRVEWLLDPSTGKPPRRFGV